MTISGTEFYRRKKRMKKYDLSKKAGIGHSSLLKLLSQEDCSRVSIGVLDRIAGVLNVTIDDLLVSHDEEELDEVDYLRPSPTDSPFNAIAVYRRAHALSYDKLGERLSGLSREGARKICRSDIAPSKYIETLATLENTTTSEFIEKYHYNSYKELFDD